MLECFYICVEKSAASLAHGKFLLISYIFLIIDNNSTIQTDIQIGKVGRTFPGYISDAHCLIISVIQKYLCQYHLNL